MYWAQLKSKVLVITRWTRSVDGITSKMWNLIKKSFGEGIDIEIER